MSEFVADGKWVCRQVDQCTGGACGLGYGHEPGCGLEAVANAGGVADAKNFASLLNEYAERAEKAEAAIERVREVCEQQVMDRSLYSSDRQFHTLDRIDGWNDALEMVERALDEPEVTA